MNLMICQRVVTTLGAGGQRGDQTPGVLQHPHGHPGGGHHHPGPLAINGLKTILAYLPLMYDTH